MNDEAIFLVNYDKAIERISEVTDLALSQFLWRGVKAMVAKPPETQSNALPFDMLYFIDLLTEMFASREGLVAILNGEDLRWWDDV